MKEIDYRATSKVIWPQQEKVEIDSSVDFVYIMRKDGDHTMSPIIQRVADEYLIDEGRTKQVFLEEYDTFFNNLSDIIQWGYASKGNFQLHVYDPNALDKKIRAKAGDYPILSQDSLMSQGVLEYKVSRGYYLGGKKDFGLVQRPGTPPLLKQAVQINHELDGLPTVFVEDGIYSGRSVIASLIELRRTGIQVKKIVSGIQVGKPNALFEMGISVDPVVKYETTDGADLFDKVDFGNPRDYLLGASGLVLKLPNGRYGRAPYILPFVSTTARAGVPQQIEKEFALKVLKANLGFFKNVENILGKPMLLKNMDFSFVVLMNEMFGFDSYTSMDNIAKWFIDNLDTVWEMMEAQGKFQENLAELNLPQNMVFIDVNGTLIPDDAKDGYISPNDISLLKQTINLAKQRGLFIGLCSDSPLQQLQELAEKFGIDGPIVAENGNVIYSNGKTLIINRLNSIESIKAQIIGQAKELGYQQDIDYIAPEFGGKKIEPDSGSWGFEANRQTSVTVFGPPALLESLGIAYNGNSEYSVDASPESNYFAIHPGENFKVNKEKTFTTLRAYGYNVVIVGNSVSDWVELSA